MAFIKDNKKKLGQKNQEETTLLRLNPELDMHEHNPGAERKFKRGLKILQSVKEVIK